MAFVGAAVSKTNMQAEPAAPASKPRLSWGEKRDRRRNRRRLFEEVLGWILVPAILYGAYLMVQAAGGIPKEVQDIIGEVFAAITGAR